jgi:hypothetical protein
MSVPFVRKFGGCTRALMDRGAEEVDAPAVEIAGDVSGTLVSSSSSIKMHS